MTDTISGTHTRVVPLAELPPGTRKAVTIDGKPVLVCNANGNVRAIGNICTHADKSLERGRLGQDSITCPAHGAKFSLTTGAALALPATRSIPVYDVRVVDEWVEVRV